MDFINRRREQAASENGEKFERYRLLVRKAAAGKLSAKEDQALSEVMTAVGISLEQLETDANCFAHEAALNSEATKILGTLEEEQAALKAIEQLQREAEEFERQFRPRFNNAMAKRRAAASEANRLKAVADQLVAHRSANWKLLGHPDPVVAGRRRHLVQAVRRVRADNSPEYSAIDFESVMASPGAVRFADSWEFVPSPGQTREELRDLLARANAMIRSGRQSFYLLPAGTDTEPFNHRDRIVLADQHLGTEHLNVPWERMPGQTIDEFERLKASVKPLVEQNENRRRLGAVADPSRFTQFDRYETAVVDKR